MFLDSNKIILTFLLLFSFMAFSAISINTAHNHHHSSLFFAPKHQHHHPNNTKIHRFQIQCNGTNQNHESQPQTNAFLKVAWYSSELLGIAASAFRSPSDEEEASPPQRLLQTIDRASVVDTIKQDFQRSYFVTGLIT